jgi:hypothetical protein
MVTRRGPQREGKRKGNEDCAQKEDCELNPLAALSRFTKAACKEDRPSQPSNADYRGELRLRSPIAHIHLAPRSRDWYLCNHST